jgi:NADH-quinone oxidoreductase subunit G/NADP-reducing hydrogenase subunit HndD
VIWNLHNRNDFLDAWIEVNTMIEMQVDGRTIEAKEGETILSALKREGVHVPTLCYMEGLLPSGACRMCVVESQGAPNLLPSCSFPVAPGMKILTRSPKVLEARKTIVELLLSNHPDDCLYCARSGKCDLQQLSQSMGIRQRAFRGKKNEKERDLAGPIIRDPEKCILCGRCVRVCEEIQGVGSIDFVNRGCKAYIGTAFDQGLNVSTCVNCGQCIVACPTGALTEHSYIEEVVAALADPEKMVVVQHAPAVSVSLAEEFGVEPGQDVDGKMVAALRRIGFARVFDTSFTADLTIMEEASELAQRVATGGVLPMFTSCSPGWIKFVETFYPDLIPNLSTCKSPQQMMGAIIKSYFAEREKIDPAKIVSVSIMPCTAKKFESGRPEMAPEHIPDVDYVLTTRELGQLLHMFGVDLLSMTPQAPDMPFGERTSAGKIFGASGGVMEAAVRTAHYLLTGQELAKLDIQPLRGMKGAKEIRAKIGDLEVGAAVVSSLLNARKLLDEIRAGRKDLQFIEFMTCPGGCINGGGQPIGADSNAARSRMQALYKIDQNEDVRVSHKNTHVMRLYDEYLGKPLGEKSHHLLHTHYSAREII